MQAHCHKIVSRGQQSDNSSNRCSATSVLNPMRLTRIVQKNCMVATLQQSWGAYIALIKPNENESIYEDENKPGLRLVDNYVQL